MIKSFKSNKGFTLVELIIVIAILAIIMLIAIPNFSGIQQRMQVRADKSTAAQIGKAVRVWFTDYTTDKGLVASADADKYVPVQVLDAGGDEVNPGLPTAADGLAVAYDGLAGIAEYIAIGQRPNSLTDGDGKKEEHQFYAITLSNGATSSDAKILVSICSGTEQIDDNETPGDTSDDTVTGIVIDAGEGDVPTNLETITEPDYNGSKPAVAYIEP